MPPTLDIITGEIGILHPSFVIWTGDAIEGYGDTHEQAESEYDTFLLSAARCGVPMFSAPGNHELGFNDPTFEPIYIKKMGPTYGSFDYGNSHFIALDTSPIIGDAVSFGAIDPAQMAWLQSDLEANKGAANIFVFFHHYLFGPPDPDTPDGPKTGFSNLQDRDALHAIFKKYGVRAVFAGHNHISYHTVVDGIDYYIAGNAGAPLDADPEDGGFFGYDIVHVDGAQATVESVAIPQLAVRPISGGDGTAMSAVVQVDNYGHRDHEARGIQVLMPAGHTYSVTAYAAYKKKKKPVDASIASTTPSIDGKTEMLLIAAVLPHSRTITIEVTGK